MHVMVHTYIVAAPEAGALQIPGLPEIFAETREKRKGWREGEDGLPFWWGECMRGVVSV